MQIKIRVVTGAKKERVIKEKDVYKIYVSTPREKGRANERLVQLLATHFKVKKSSISIISGLRAKEKIVKVVT